MDTDREDVSAAMERGVILAKIEDLRAAIHDLDGCFDKFKETVGLRMQESEKDISANSRNIKVLETEVGMILWILRGVATPVLGAIGLSAMGFFVYHYAHGG